MLSKENVRKHFFLGVFCIKWNVNKISNFWPNHGLTPLEKCQFGGFLKPMFSLFRKVCLVYKMLKIVFLGFFFTMYDMGIPGVTRGYTGLQRVTGGYKGWQGVTKGLQGVTKDYRNFLLTSTFPDTFSWSILHKNQSWRNLKFLTKKMDVWKNSPQKKYVLEKFQFCVFRKQLFL